MTTRRERRAARSARGRMKLLEGGKPIPEDTPSQRFAEDLKAHIKQYLQSHSGLDMMNVTKVVGQLAAQFAFDQGCRTDDEYAQVARHLFAELLETKT